jgi:hypothetical protein
LIKNRHKYTNFNTLGLYRSIVENQKLDLVQKIAVRELAHEHFLKTFEFLQLKDPFTYFEVSTLGQTLTVADKRQCWKHISTNQQQILKQKRIKHRNFGFYAKHVCGYEHCPYNDVMIPNSHRHRFVHISFNSDENICSKQLKAQYQQVAKRAFRDARIELICNSTIDSDLGKFD